MKQVEDRVPLASNRSTEECENKINNTTQQSDPSKKVKED